MSLYILKINLILSYLVNFLIFWDKLNSILLESKGYLRVSCFVLANYSIFQI